MSSRTIPMTDALYDYYLNSSLREPDVLARLRATTSAHPEGNMRISPEQGQFMRFLVGLIGARKAIEIGTYTGYSALSVALAMPTGSRLVACERRPGQYDFAFIDGDKKNYVNYYELCLKLVRPGGVIALDNMLWSGRLVDPTLDDPASTAIRILNEKIRDDARVDSSLIPIGDGLALVRKLVD